MFVTQTKSTFHCHHFKGLIVARVLDRRSCLSLSVSNSVQSGRSVCALLLESRRVDHARKRTQSRRPRDSIATTLDSIATTLYSITTTLYSITTTLDSIATT